MKSNFLPLGIALAVICGGLLQPTERVAAETDLGKTLKKIFSTPTPTPHKKKKKTSPTPSPTPKKKSSTTPTPSASPKKKSKESATPEEEAVPEETPKAKKKASPAEDASPSKKSKAKATPEESATPHKKHTPASEEAEATPETGEKKKHKATPTPEETPTPTPEESAAEASPSPTATAKASRVNVATIATDQIAGYDNYPDNVKRLIELSLNLTTQNLDYKYGSNDPSSGGLDCSGFVNYVLNQMGLKNVPRDSREQYAWVRKSGNFQAVLSKHDDTFELNELKPGDLMFWTGTYAVSADRDPAISHVMIYLGREKKTNKRIMVGSSDGRTYNGQSRFGVSIFDFKVARLSRSPENGNGNGGPTFVGYGPVPGL